jgi:aryl-alcohol dehydrogenase-like predicted oxidoreductase
MADKFSPAVHSGTFRIGGDLPVHRLGFGAMRITGKGIWGEPEDCDEAIRVLRRSLELGINFIDTADSYGPEVSERLIAEALYPYPKNLVIATRPVSGGRDPASGSRTAGPNTSGGRSRAASGGSGSSGSICCSSTASIPRCRSRTSSAP